MNLGQPSKIGRYLRVNFKPFCKWYYRNFNQQEILRVLYAIKDEQPRSLEEIAMICVNKYGWTDRKAVISLGKAIYCGYIGTVSKMDSFSKN